MIIYRHIHWNMFDFATKNNTKNLRKAHTKQTKLTDLFIHIDFYGVTKMCKH